MFKWFHEQTIGFFIFIIFFQIQIINNHVNILARAVVQFVLIIPILILVNVDLKAVKENRWCIQSVVDTFHYMYIYWTKIHFYKNVLLKTGWDTCEKLMRPKISNISFLIIRSGELCVGWNINSVNQTNFYSLYEEDVQ